MATKVCTRCGIEKDINEFWNSNSTKDGHRYHCKECEYEKRQAKITQNHLEYMLKVCISRAKQEHSIYDPINDLYNDIKPAYDKFECEKCNRKLESGIGKGKQSARSPSIDRVDPHGGYAVGNIALLCNECNAKKRNNSLQDFRDWVSWMEDRMANIYAANQ